MPEQTSRVADPVRTEILRNRFEAIVEEMAENITRTSFSVFVKQTADFGTSLVTPDGEVFAAPTAIANNLMIGIPAKAAIESLAPYRPGDVGISNDPEATRGLVTHLPDIWMWKPLFVDGELIAFAFSFVHVSDIGGSVPGSISFSHRDVYAEGLRIPPSRLYREDTLNSELVSLILANSRIPDQTWGDLKAQIASFHLAERRLRETCHRYGRGSVTAAMADLLAQAEQRAGDIVAKLPDGTYRFTDYVESADPQLPPTRLQLTMTITGRQMLLSFTGTSPQVDEAINLPSYGQQGHYMLVFTLVNYFCSLDPSIPYNSGLARPLLLDLPEGSVVNPRPGAACGVRATVFIRVMDCVMGCLAQADPDRAFATSSGAIAIVLVSSADPDTGATRVSVAQPLTGGSGGRPGQDGVDATSYTGGWLRNVPNEVLEHESPVLVERYGFVPDSGGAGRYRGGSGIALTLRALADDIVIAVRGMERLRFQPWGVAGGTAGSPARSELNPGRPGGRPLGRIDVMRLDTGDVIHVETAGGGGLGSPSERSADAVLADLRAGVITSGRARDVYGQTPRPDGFFDFGEARTRFELTWPQDVQEYLVTRSASWPPGRRGRLYREVFARLSAAAGTRPVTTADVDETVAALLAGVKRGGR